MQELCKTDEELLGDMNMTEEVMKHELAMKMTQSSHRTMLHTAWSYSMMD